MHHSIKKNLLAIGVTLGLATTASAADWEVKVTNLTHGNHFTPLLVTAHDHDTHLFKVGDAASTAIEHMAECGHLDPLLATSEVGAADADTIVNPAEGVLAPGATTTAMITTSDTHLSVVAMVLPTNDGFVGLESQHIPAEAGSYTYWVNAYDAGTEENDEILATSGSTCTYTDSGMMPGAPGGDAGTGATGVSSADGNTMIHVHRGVLGDDSLTDGKSDLVNTIHRWQNPVAKVVVTVTP